MIKTIIEYCGQAPCRESINQLSWELTKHKEALRDLVKLIDDGLLVRNVSRDNEPGWALRQLPLVQTLANVAKLVDADD